jgi:hypothetical protein
MTASFPDGAHASLSRYVLDGQARKYMRTVLAGSTLARTLSRVNLERGTIVSWLPPDVAQDRVHRFESGGMTSKQASLDVLTTLAVTHLQEQDRQCIIEHPLARPTDHAIRQLRAPLIFHGDEVYFRLDRHVDAPTVRETLSTAFFQRLVAAIVSAQVLDVDDVRIAAECRAIFVGAYDGEGLLWWTPAS